MAITTAVTPPNERQREAVIVAVALGDPRLERRVARRDQIAELIGEAGEHRRAPRRGESSFRWTGTIPHAPWTATCIRKPPIAEHQRGRR